MRIGHDNNFLSIEVFDPLDTYSPFRLEAFAVVGGRRFAVVHDGIVMDTSEATRLAFAKFAEFSSAEAAVQLSEGGWFRFERDARGYIVMRYRISDWTTSAVMEGKVLIEGEHAGGFCRDFGKLLLVGA